MTRPPITHRKLALLDKCTKATTVHACEQTPLSAIPPNVRRLPWDMVKPKACKNFKVVGKGTFAKCYATDMGSMRVCVKVLYAGTKFKSLFFNEAKILSELCHYNIPWLHALVDDSKTALVMTFHPYKQIVLNIHNALYEGGNNKVDEHQWKQVLPGCTSALMYLQTQKILHNDIKADNILIEETKNDVRAVLIDFNKACSVENSRFYHLSLEQQKYYSLHYPQVAPEVRRGVCRQSFASDIFAFGRVLKKVNDIILKTPYLLSLSELCLADNHLMRPTANELHTSLTNMFSSG